MHRYDAVLQFGGDLLSVDCFADCRRTVEIADAVFAVQKLDVCVARVDVTVDTAAIALFTCLCTCLERDRSLGPRPVTGTKKADVAEHLSVFCHVGLLVDEPPSQGRVALHLVIRQLIGQAAIH